MHKPRQVASNFLFLFRPYWRYGKLLVLLTLLGGVIAAPIGQIAGVTVAQAVIDAVMVGYKFAAVLKIVCIYFAVYAMSYIIQNGVKSFYGNWKSEEISVKIKRDIFEQAQHTDLRWIDDPTYFNKLNIALSNYVGQSQNIMESATQILTSVITSFAMIGVIAQTGIVIVLIIITGLILSMVIQTKMISAQMRAMPEQMELQRKMDYTTRVYQQSSYSADMKSTRAAELIIDKYKSGAKKFITFVRRLQRKVGLFTLGSTWTTQITHYCIILYIAFGLLSGRIESVGSYATLIAAAGVLSSSFSILSFIGPQISKITQAADLIRSFYNLHSPIETSKGDAPPNGKFSIELCNVSFAYPNNPDFAIRDVNICLASGEKIAIVGENGAGKSTLMKLLLRLYNVDSGTILYNGRNIKEYDVHALRLSVGVAFQTPSIYAMTLGENLQTYRIAASSRLRESLVRAGLDKLSDALNVEVTKEFDKNGIMLSGGEAQKLGLARLFADDFGLLLLDEPSSALDPLAEYELMKQLLNHSNTTTTIMVAHRLSTVRNADRIYIVDNGTVVEQGSHDELMSLGGKYAEMFMKQAENYAL